MREHCYELDHALNFTQEEIIRSDNYGGLRCDIFHRISKTSVHNPLFKFKRTVLRMLKLARLRRTNVGASFTNLISLAKKKIQPVTSPEKTSPQEKLEIFKTMNSQST